MTMKSKKDNLSLMKEIKIILFIALAFSFYVLVMLLGFLYVAIQDSRFYLKRRLICKGKHIWTSREPDNYDSSEFTYECGRCHIDKVAFDTKTDKYIY